MRLLGLTLTVALLIALAVLGLTQLPALFDEPCQPVDTAPPLTLMERIDRFERTCGPAPFEVKVFPTGEEHWSCQRPQNLGRVKLPKP